MVKITFSKRGRCDITGNQIHSTEPCILIFDDKIVKIDAFQEYIDGFKEIKETPFHSEYEVGFNITLRHFSFEQECSRCEYKKDMGVEIHLTDGEIETKSLYLCNNCLDEYIEVIEESYEIIKDILEDWSEAGFYVLNIDGEQVKEDFIENIEIEEEYSLLIGCSENIATSLTNILEVINVFESYEDYDFIEQADESRIVSKLNCSICDEKKEKCLIIEKEEEDNFKICTMCRDVVVSELEEYCESNKAMINSIAL